MRTGVRAATVILVLAVVAPNAAAVATGEITLTPATKATPPEAVGLSTSPAGLVYRARSPNGLQDTWEILAAGSATPVALTPGGPLPFSTVGGVTDPVIVGDEVAVPIAAGPSEHELASVEFYGLDAGLIDSVPMAPDELYLGFTGHAAIVLHRLDDLTAKLVVRSPGSPDTVLVDLPWGVPEGLITDTTGGFFAWMAYGVAGLQVFRLSFADDTAQPFDTSPDSNPLLGVLNASLVGWRSGVSSNTEVLEPRAGGAQTRITVAPNDCIACLGGFAVSGSTVGWTRTVACLGSCTYALALRPSDGTGTDTEAGLTLVQPSVRTAPGGGFIVVGEAPSGGTAILRVSEDGSDVSVVQSLEPLWASVSALQLSAGRVVIGDDSAFPGAVSSVTLTSGPGGLIAGSSQTLASDHSNDPTYDSMLASGDRTAYVRQTSTGSEAVVLDGDTVERTLALPSGSFVQWLSGDHLLFTERPWPGDYATKVLNVRTGNTVEVPPQSALWGRWVVYIEVVQTDQGGQCRVVRRDVDAAASSTNPSPVTHWSGCNLEILGWWGPWLALRVGSSGEVRNIDTGEAIPIPWTSHLGVGDGYVVALQYDGIETDDLVGLDLVDAAHPLTAFGSILAKSPQNPWALDQRGGQLVAWFGDDRLVHVAPVGVPAGEPRELDRSAPGRFSPNHDGIKDVWRAEFDVSKAVAWKLVLKDGAGHVVRRRAGGAPFGSIGITWRGCSDAGTKVAAGRYTWMLRIHGADGIGSTAMTGTVDVVR